ncbi:Nucleoporin Nup43 [Pseudolycoriella hygida]|uniref:Nucleoporin Nup43 n=1 Tax=Pseudolycoriella hygida TaxID=35572 RepID=A0A9Q0RYX1_9DIPT|nr:Nucleoporin Nup43 [Pseudolycoriella hygida]
MATAKLNASVISEKVSKIRWVPEQYGAPQSFVTGNWDFASNNVRIWTYVQNELSDDEVEYTPKSTAKVNIAGDVTGIQFVNLDNFLVSSSSGKVNLLNINRDLAANNLVQKHAFEGLHTFPGNSVAPCTDISVCGNSVATVGEDGRLNIVNLSGMTVTKSFDEADHCSILCVNFINHKEILTGNRMGIIKIFDSLSDQKQPVTTLFTSCENDKNSNAVSAITHHPTQTHIVLSGCEEGSITVWDLRQPEYPASYLSAHDSSITEIAFHPTEPVKVYTSSEGGELFQWLSSSNQFTVDGIVHQPNTSETINPWLSGERTKNSISWTPLISGIHKSINSFSVCGSKMVCSSDNEAIYFIDNCI